jgi:hypothetical protein
MIYLEVGAKLHEFLISVLDGGCQLTLWSLYFEKEAGWPQRRCGRSSDKFLSLPRIESRLSSHFTDRAALDMTASPLFLALVSNGCDRAKQRLLGVSLLVIILSDPCGHIDLLEQ